MPEFLNDEFSKKIMIILIIYEINHFYLNESFVGYVRQDRDQKPFMTLELHNLDIRIKDTCVNT